MEGRKVRPSLLVVLREETGKEERVAWQDRGRLESMLEERDF